MSMTTHIYVFMHKWNLKFEILEKRGLKEFLQKMVTVQVGMLPPTYCPSSYLQRELIWAEQIHYSSLHLLQYHPLGQSCTFISQGSLQDGPKRSEEVAGQEGSNFICISVETVVQGEAVLASKVPRFWGGCSQCAVIDKRCEGIPAGWRLK